MKKFLLLALAPLAIAAIAQDASDQTPAPKYPLTIPTSLDQIPAVNHTLGYCAKAWMQPNINEVKRMEMHTNFFAYESAEAARLAQPEASRRYRSLNGQWDFYFQQDADSLLSGFCFPNYNTSDWGTIPVPGC